MMGAMSTPFSLGRIQEHDEASRAFAAPTQPALQTVTWDRTVPIFDQGRLGSCTGNAMAGTLMTEPYVRPDWHFDETTAVALYSAATQLDSQAGTYPPDDTGSSGLAVAKAAQRAGYISAYNHAFGIEHLLGALMLGPLIIGIPWLNSMFDTDDVGNVRFDGSSGVAGGHEVSVVGYDVALEVVTFANSWGDGWGLRGYGQIESSQLAQLLSDGGDATVPVL